MFEMRGYVGIRLPIAFHTLPPPKIAVGNNHMSSLVGSDSNGIQDIPCSFPGLLKRFPCYAVYKDPKSKYTCTGSYWQS